MRGAAMHRPPRAIFEFVDRGTEDDLAVANNRAGFTRIKLRQRAMIDVSRRNLATSIFGADVGLPVAIAPTGFAGLCWYDGEVALAREAQAANIPFTLATGALASIERVAREAGPDAGGRLWFQLNVWQDRQRSYQLMERARRAGYEALIVTADTPVSPNREYNIRNGFSLPFAMSPRFAFDVVQCCVPLNLGSSEGVYLGIK
ncbi:alpha-hydroxy acid oxidase [Caballeronia sp. dw_19]|uniref:alpha-hydroxy acid oxidase n=1 Tax=Caballeronia sp. dw_19 TaxID=2719791 RepID=UPI001BD4DE5E|nr:alpha-hydroxy acid oxidase [Caballeronia sp. dw_19]